MSDRRVKVTFEAEISKFKQGMADAASATEKLAQATEKTGKSVDERMQKINMVATADQKAAKAAGLLYNAQGQLADSNGKVLSSTQAAAHGVEAFSEAVYLSGHEASVAADATEAAAKKAAEAAEKQKAAWQTVAPVMMAAGAGIVAGVGMAVKKYADFDKAMSSVQAATHESTGNMNQLREAAIEAGADTAFSAEEAAQGIEELAKAGVSTESILSGGLNGALSLAAAGNLGVGESAEIAASAMTQFKLSGDQIPHLADLLAAGAGKAQGSVQDLGAALDQSGLVAASTGLTIEETTGALAAFASAGLTGSDAGTSMKTMLQAFNPVSGKAATLMDELGISAYDASGEFVGMSEYAGILRGALVDMSSEQRNATMKTIFGSDAVRAANVLYEQGAEGIQKWEDAVNDAGYAAETAAIMQDNLAGDLEKLGGAFDTVFIKSGSGANDFLRDLVQSAEDAVDAFGKIPTPILTATTSIAGVVGVTALAVGGFIKLAPAVMDTWSAFKDLGGEGSRMPGKLGKVTQAAGILAAAYAALSTAAILASEARAGFDKPVKSSEIINALTEITTKGESSAKALDRVFSGSVVTGGGKGIGGAPTAVNDLASAMERLHNPSGFDNINDFFGTIFGPGVTSGSEVVRENIGEMDSALVSLANSAAFEQAAAGFKMLHDQTLESGGDIDDVKESASGYLDALRDVASAAGVAVTEQDLLNWALTGTPPAAVAAAGAAEETASALEEVGLSADGAIESMDKFLESLFALGNINMSAREAAAAYQEALEGVTEAQEEIAKGKMGKTLNKTKDDFNLTTEAGKLAQAEFHGLAKGGMAEVEAMAAQGLGQDELQGKLNTTYSDLVKAGEGFGLSGKAAQELAREVLGVPDGVDIKTWMDTEAKRVAEETTGALDAIPGYVSVAVAVSEDGTVGEVQGKIDSVTGKTEYVFVTDDGTVVNVQQKIENVNGVERTVYVGDDGTVYTTQGKINSVTDGSATVNVSADGINNVQQSINGIKGKTVTVRVGYSDPGTPIGFGSLIPGRASGGSIFGAGSDTSDSILIRASNNEHVLSAKEVRGLGGHGAVESLRAMARSGSLPAFKNGGRVGAAEKKVSSTKRAYDRISGDKANRLRKLAAKDQYDAAKAELAAVKKSSKASADAAKKSADARKKAAEEERARQGRLSDSRRELRTDLRRGDIVDSFTSGSGLSQIDKLGDASRNKDYGKNARRGLARDANALEKSLTILTKKSENLKTALESATDQASELRSVRDSVAGDLRGEFSLSGMLSTTRQDLGANPFTARGISGAANKMARRIEIFAGRLNKLRKMGYGETIIQEVAGLGTEDGITVAGVLMNATQGERSSIVGAYKRLDTASGQAGQYVTESMYKGGLNAADGLVNGLKSKTKDVESAFYKLGKDAEKAFKRSLGIRSPSKSAEGWMGHVVDGSVLGVDRNTGKLESAMRGLGLAGEAAFDMQPAVFSVPPSAEVARYAAQPAAAQYVQQGITPDQLRSALSGMDIRLNTEAGTVMAKLVNKGVHDATRGQVSIYQK